MEKKPTNSAEIEQLLSWHAALNDMIIGEKWLEKRLAMVKNGKRDLHLAKAVFKKLLDRLLETVPEAKLEYMIGMLSKMTYACRYNGTVSKSETGWTHVKCDHLEALQNAAYEKCQLCMDGNCRACGVGRAFDGMLTVSRGKNERWADINIEERMRIENASDPS